MYITALDIGTSQVKALVAELKNDGRMTLLGIFKVPISGLRRGEIVSPEDVMPALNRLFVDVKKISKSAVKNICVNVGGAGVRLQGSRGIVAVSRADNEIYQDDIDRVIKASQAVNIGPNRMILHTLTKEFIVDGASGIRDPLGMTGNRLEVESLLIDAFRATVNSLIKCVEMTGGEIRGGLVYGPLAASQSALSKAQKDLGAILIDIGGGTTGMSVYEENNLLHAAVLPTGSGHVTNDLAIGLRCSVKAAEAIKISFGSALAKGVPLKEQLDLNQIDEGLKSAVNRRFISEIIEVRLSEIFELVNNELKLIGRAGKLPAGAVLAGGGAKMPGVVDLARHELKLPVQIGIPEILNMEITNAEFENMLEDPEFAVAAGLLVSGSNQFLRSGGWFKGKKGNWFSRILEQFLP